MYTVSYTHLAHVVGYDANGKNGLESLANFQLMTSHDGYLSQAANELKSEKNLGDNVVSTLNASLQQTAYNALGDNRGAVVVMDPRTGAVLASVSKPDFNPNTVAQDWDYLVSDNSNSSLLNRATQGAYPPGSTFKIVTALAYLKAHGSIDGCLLYTSNLFYYLPVLLIAGLLTGLLIGILSGEIMKRIPGKDLT